MNPKKKHFTPAHHPFESKNPGKGLEIVFGWFGAILSAITIFFAMIIFAPIALVARLNDYWERPKKRDWQSEREDYYAGKAKK